MLRRGLLLIPALGAVAALAGTMLADRPLLAALLAAAAGLALALALVRAADRRTRAVAARIDRLASGEPPERTTLVGTGQWRRLQRSLDAVGRSVRARFDELAAERARVERLLDTLPTAVLLFGERGLAYANPAARALFSLADGESRTPLQALGARGLAGAVEEAQETGTVVEVEVEHDERELFARASATTAGEVALVVADLTDLRRIERVRRDFVTNASHELKTPVAGIQVLSESLALALERDPARARRMVDRLHTEALRLGQLVRDLLDLARVEELGIEGRRERVDVAKLVRDLLERVRETAAERGVRLRCEAPAEATVVAVPQDLRLALGNLLDNAVRYNREGGEVAVRVRRADGEVRVEIADTGLGISEAEQERVFERFYRVDKGRSRQAGGTGLGLSIARHAVARQGGRITLRSVLGVGSTFTVTLPVEGAA